MVAGVVVFVGLLECWVNTNTPIMGEGGVIVCICALWLPLVFIACIKRSKGMCRRRDHICTKI